MDNTKSIDDKAKEGAIKAFPVRYGLTLVYSDPKIPNEKIDANERDRGIWIKGYLAHEQAQEADMVGFMYWLDENTYEAKWKDSRRFYTKDAKPYSNSELITIYKSR